MRVEVRRVCKTWCVSRTGCIYRVYIIIAQGVHIYVHLCTYVGTGCTYVHIHVCKDGYTYVYVCKTGCVYFKAKYVEHSDGGMLVLFAHDTVDPLHQPTEQPSIQCLGQAIPGE